MDYLNTHTSQISLKAFIRFVPDKTNVQNENNCSFYLEILTCSQIYFCMAVLFSYMSFLSYNPFSKNICLFVCVKMRSAVGFSDTLCIKMIQCFHTVHDCIRLYVYEHREDFFY